MVRRAPVTAVAIAAALVLSGCTAEVAVTPAPSPRPSAPAASGDGVLRIGTLLPTSGETAFLSPAQVAGVELAVREINEAGGVLGAPVEVFHRNSGDATTETLEASYAQLVEHGVDVIVGPSSSVLAERLLPLTAADGIAVISPSATASALSDLDDSGLLLRTSPPVSLQGRALAQLLTDDGAETVATVTFDDTESAAVTSVLSEAMGDGSVTFAETFAGDTDAAAFAARVAESGVDAVVLSSPFTPGVPTAALLDGLVTAGIPATSLWVTAAGLADYSQALPAGAIEGVRGVLDGREPSEEFAARAKSMDPGLSDVRYAAEAYDATVLAALAAIVAEDDGGPSLAYSAIDVSGAGIKCMSFGECLDVLESRPDIDYDGVSGPLALNDSGDPTVAVFRVFTYGADNRAVPGGDVLVE
ncbi:amino acid ABC transporter substrate-binding protein [Salinibacterium sp. dk2585]|uniref:ABC transporter substrate-binding protein n=1 Tax=unclassified Salinibacterium TaxID=2632331 RepID=UPI0011C251AA|nr:MULTISPECIES: ABC transporter substrate-binding protein [unclassified Salinibacterium]QEE60659.1 amino acid ABC transporter substrate-binding protein [Salinibacterium sp. dk2585]TXK55731.1 amino acid ABC transporter substrate-binding protein [Salinibacterium sp. dk5596]